VSASTVICDSCGNPVPAERLFCPSCGALVVAAAPAAEGHLVPDHVGGVEPDEGALPLEADPASAPALPPPPAVPPVFAPFEPGPAEPLTQAPLAQAAPGAQPAWPADPPVQPPAPAPSGSAPPEPVRRPGQAPLLADLPFDAPSDLPGWLVAIGAGIATVAFFLPWAPQVFGSGGFGRYLDQWGFATLSHLPGFLFAGVVTGLALLPNRIPAWLRSGVLPLLLGGYLMGLVWPYVAGGFGARIGSIAEAAAAILLAVGGTLALGAGRGGSSESG
jgi:hypothetical protein